jgi:hypothetical protein
MHNPSLRTLAALFSLPLLALFSSCEPDSSGSDSEETVNEGKALVMESIAAHGGTEPWYNNGLLHFRWQYHMSDRGPDAVVDSRQTFNPKTMAVTHTVPDSEMRFGWNDGQAWVLNPEEDFPTPPAFWALTPTYFIGIPFVFNDPNARFEKLAESKSFEGKDYTQVKVTYTDDAGDSPDDYYVLLIDPETKATRGAYYIVTHPLVAPDGPGPEKFITLDNLQNVGGVRLASSHRTFKMENGEIGDQMRHTEVSEVRWITEGEADLTIPEGAAKL